MSEILFYHLERSRIEAVLPDLLQKTLQKGWSATVRTGSVEAVTKIDDLLWTFADDAFLSHGIEGEEGDHPIWITAQAELKKEAELLFLVEGAEADIKEIKNLMRCILIFDGADEVAVQQARNFWKEAKDTPHEATYWKQTPTGKWQKQGG